MAHNATHVTQERRRDVQKAADAAEAPKTYTCPNCGKKVAVGKTGTAIGGGTAAAAGGGGG